MPGSGRDSIVHILMTNLLLFSRPFLIFAYKKGAAAVLPFYSSAATGRRRGMDLYPPHRGAFSPSVADASTRPSPRMYAATLAPAMIRPVT